LINTGQRPVRKGFTFPHLHIITFSHPSHLTFSNFQISVKNSNSTYPLNRNYPHPPAVYIRPLM